MNLGFPVYLDDFLRDNQPSPPKYSQRPELAVEIELFQAYPLTSTAKNRKK